MIMKFAANLPDPIEVDSPEQIVIENASNPHPINKNVFGNIKKSHCDDNIDQQQNWTAISIIAVCVCAILIVYRGTETLSSKRSKKKQVIYNLNSILIFVVFPVFHLNTRRAREKKVTLKVPVKPSAKLKARLTASTF